MKEVRRDCSIEATPCRTGVTCMQGEIDDLQTNDHCQWPHTYLNPVPPASAPPRHPSNDANPPSPKSGTSPNFHPHSHTHLFSLHSPLSTLIHHRAGRQPTMPSEAMKAVDIRDGKGPASSLFINSDVPKPQPKPTECLVRVKAFGLNRADTMQREGKYVARPHTPSRFPRFSCLVILRAEHEHRPAKSRN